MPFPSKIQPVDAQGAYFSTAGDVPKPVPAKSRFKRLFERQFVGGLRTSSVEKAAGAAEGKERDVVVAELEPSSVCLAKMVQNFMEAEPNERPPPPPRCGRRRCNCFNGSCDDNSDDELDYTDDFVSSAPSCDAADLLKSLVPCASMAERNLLADASRIVEKNKDKACCGGRAIRGSECRKTVVDGLVDLGHDAAVCRSRWENTTPFPAGAAGEYEYVDAILGTGERLIIDIDFRSEFEIARPTKSYRAALQALPAIYVGREDRLAQIVAVVSEAARQSLKKRGLHVPPWRKPEYMRAKWLSSHHRTDAPGSSAQPHSQPAPTPHPPSESIPSKDPGAGGEAEADDGAGDGLEVTPDRNDKEGLLPAATPPVGEGRPELRYEESGRLAAYPPPSLANTPPSGVYEGKEAERGKSTEEAPRAAAWQLPAVKPKAPRAVTGLLASIVRDLG